MLFDVFKQLEKVIIHGWTDNADVFFLFIEMVSKSMQVCKTLLIKSQRLVSPKTKVAVKKRTM